ncbi:FMN-binding protein [uncultured Brachyspira sp.]|uniref:FMN-binding protein n=1 Tax=uncultured Brachyspira sp. TaxID=221953 RepID=UPI0026383439|nr:FMN-binding protein [uncultured Brachyspira sp.]
MKKKEVTYKAVISVTVTALIAGFLLSFVYSSFEKDILANNEKTVLNGVKAVIPNADNIEGPISENAAYPYYIGKKADGSVAGYAILSSAGGYNGQNKVLVGFSDDAATITGIVVTEQAETPGLGAKIVEPSFRNQFTNKSSVVPLTVVKGIKPEEALDAQIAAISGATISSTSVVTAVNSANEQAVNLFLQ